MPKGWILFLCAISLFCLFVLFSFLVHKNFFTQFDFDMTVRLQDNLPRRVDNEFSFLSEVGSFEVSLVVLFVLMGILFYLRKFLTGITAFVFFGIFHLIELFGKFFVDHLPPPQFMLRTKEIVEFPQFHVRSEFSYPSGHAGRAGFLSTILIGVVLTNKRLSKQVKIGLCCLIIMYDFLMVASRVYLGEHWSTDVIGGSLVGIAFGLFSITLLFFPKKKTT